MWATPAQQQEQEPDARGVPSLLHPLDSLAIALPGRSITVLALQVFMNRSINYRRSPLSSYLDHMISSGKNSKVRTNNR